ncbi:MAG TPA: NnrU family protein [Ktedonobacterales bacterium]|nr:NnrU family protein [Ktedonobacterales bacterium]
MKYLPTLLIGVLSYVLFLVAALYGVSFTLGGLLPDPIAIPHAPPALALLVDVGLLLIFGIQHSLMARSGWKKRWTTIIPPAMERSLYVLIASCILLAMFWCWQRISGVIWQVNGLAVRVAVVGVCLAGWSIVVLSTFQIDHFELFGLRQTWQALRNQPQRHVEFRRPVLYRIVRHPMMAGFLLAFWAMPTMTVDRLVFTLGMTIYILVGVFFEERALRRQFGVTYEKYQAEVPRLIPWPRKLYRLIWTKQRDASSGSVATTQR